MTRVLVKTENPSWFVDAANPESKKVRKRQDDQIFDNLLDAQSALSVLQSAHGTDTGNGGEPVDEPKATKVNGNRGTDAAKEAVQRTPPQTTVLSTGKAVTGKTVTIRCAWKGKDDGDGTKGNRCTNERTIKVQDQFQVKFCEHHQKVHRAHKRNARARARTAERKAAVVKA